MRQLFGLVAVDLVSLQIDEQHFWQALDLMPLDRILEPIFLAPILVIVSAIQLLHLEQDTSQRCHCPSLPNTHKQLGLSVFRLGLLHDIQAADQDIPFQIEQFCELCFREGPFDLV